MSFHPKAFRRAFLFFAICSFLQMHVRAQDSSHLRISLLTCTPGDELYSTFGHSGLRIIDSSAVTDYVFNYGTFDFGDEQFYPKFIRGKLRYFLAADPFEDYMYEYRVTGRGVKEQVLNLTGAEKLKIKQFLIENLKEENRYYLYDFFFDNCTTRLRDIIQKNKQNATPLVAVMPPNSSFRYAIHRYLISNGKWWSKLGIDLLLGSPTDAIMTTEQTQFLPDNLMYTLDSSKATQWVAEHHTILPPGNLEKKRQIFTPMLFFSCLLACVIFFSFVTGKLPIKLLGILDGILFFVTGLVGVVLLFMWFGTDHVMCKNNYNLLWAFPTHFIMSFWIRSRKKWARYYYAVTAISLMILLPIWYFLPQQLNVSFIPFVLLLIYRSSAMFYFYNPVDNDNE